MLNDVEYNDKSVDIVTKDDLTWVKGTPQIVSKKITRIGSSLFYYNKFTSMFCGFIQPVDNAKFSDGEVLLKLPTKYTGYAPYISFQFMNNDSATLRVDNEGNLVANGNISLTGSGHMFLNASYPSVIL